MERSSPNKVVLTMPLVSLMDENVIEALNLHFGKKMEGVSRQQVTALALAYSEEEITNEQLQHALDMHRADITNMLTKMCSQRLLESYGYGRGTKYHIYGIDVATSDGKVATWTERWQPQKEGCQETKWRRLPVCCVTLTGFCRRRI